MNRYNRNIPALSSEENQLIRNSKVCVVGCGGLGGYAIEMLARLGSGTITVIDGDVFEESNLNRQILCNESNIGENKALAAKKRVELINSGISCNPVAGFLNESNAEELVDGHDVVIDALDSIPARFILQKACREKSIPLVHGAVEGWYGQVCTIFPEDGTLKLIYGNMEEVFQNEKASTLSFAPATVSARQVSEAVKIIINRGRLLRHRLLVIDTLLQSTEEIELVDH